MRREDEIRAQEDFVARHGATKMRAGRAYGSLSSTKNKAILSLRQRREKGRKAKRRE